MSDTLLTLWHSLVAAAPAAPALIVAGQGRSWSRAELTELVRGTAERLRADAGDGALAGQSVVFSRENGPDWLATFLALLELGAIPVPLDPSESADAQHSLAVSAGAGFLLPVGGPMVPVAAKRRMRPRRAGASERFAVIKLTSGSSGQPRALAFTHAQMIADGRQVCASMGITSHDLNLGLIPFGHSYGLGNLVLPLLIQGTPVLCVSAPLHHAIAADCARWRPSVFPAVPAILRVLAQADIAVESLASLRLIISAGSALPVETARCFAEKFGKRIHGFYGSSETGGITFDRTGEATLLGRSVGTPLVGVTIRYARRGRFWVTSAAVFTRGNRHRAANGGGIHAPADRAECSPQGELVLLGRVGRMVKIASRRLDLATLEAALRRLPGVRDAYAALHAQRSDELACILCTDMPAAQARVLLQKSLVAWQVPRRVLVLPEFPLTARGKTDTRALRALLAGGGLAAADRSARS